MGNPWCRSCGKGLSKVVCFEEDASPVFKCSQCGTVQAGRTGRKISPKKLAEMVRAENDLVSVYGDSQVR